MPPVPLLILTGFLGSGKTTLLARLLREPKGERIAALVNEVGDLLIDDHLLERVDADVLALASGCVCCALRGDLRAAVARVLARRPTRIVLETTGVADPAPILDAVSADPLVRAAGVVAVVDALRAEDLLAGHPEARRQVEFADRIVLAKADLAPHRVGEVRELLAREAPGSEVRDAREVDAPWVLDAPPLARLRDAATWLHHAPAGANCRAHSVALDAPADPDVLHLWLRLVTQVDGPRLLRIKALAEGRDGRVFVLQSAGRSVSPPRPLEHHPRGVRGLQMVIIERGLGSVEPLLASLRSAVAGEPVRDSG